MRISSFILALTLGSLLVAGQAGAAPGGNGKGGGKGGSDGGSTSTPDPVLFVHGYLSSDSVWDDMKARFSKAGWPAERLVSWSYNYNQSNAATAEEVRYQVDQILAATGASKVDVISHSMGGLSSRYYLAFLGGDASVDAWVSLGGPNHGTDFAYGCYWQSCFEMRPGSSYLVNLNAGDETPGTTRYATWRSPCDSIINPDDSVMLKGATNTLTGCISHNGLLTDSGVFQEVQAWVEQ